MSRRKHFFRDFLDRGKHNRDAGALPSDDVHIPRESFDTAVSGGSTDNSISTKWRGEIFGTDIFTAAEAAVKLKDNSTSPLIASGIEWKEVTFEQLSAQQLTATTTLNATTSYTTIGGVFSRDPIIMGHSRPTPTHIHIPLDVCQWCEERLERCECSKSLLVCRECGEVTDAD